MTASSGAQVRPVGVAEVLLVAQDDPFALQRRQDVSLPAAIALVGHAPDGLADAFQLFLDGHAVGAGAEGDVRLYLLLKAADADHEELVEVRLENRQEFQALQERNLTVLRFFQDAAVEFEPAQLAVDIQRWIIERHVGGRRY
jgi:hypothetical protein